MIYERAVNPEGATLNHKKRETSVLDASHVAPRKTTLKVKRGDPAKDFDPPICDRTEKLTTQNKVTSKSGGVHVK